MSDVMTSGEVAAMFSQPVWRITRVVDSIGGASRFGGKRVIPKSLLPAIVTELGRRKWLAMPTELPPQEEVTT